MPRISDTGFGFLGLRSGVWGSGKYWGLLGLGGGVQGLGTIGLAEGPSLGFRV